MKTYNQKSPNTSWHLKENSEDTTEISPSLHLGKGVPFPLGPSDTTEPPPQGTEHSPQRNLTVGKEGGTVFLHRRQFDKQQ